MKNALLLLILFFSCLNSNAQKYAFNTLVKYSTKMNDYYNERVNYTNTDDNSYHLGLYKTENSFTAFLYDDKNLKKHEFKVIETKSKNEVFFKFEYIKSTILNLKVKNKFSDYLFTFNTLSTTDSIKKVSLNGYKNSKKKKSVVQCELEIKNYPVNLFHSFRISCMHPFEFLDYLNYNENGVVINGTATTLSGKKASFKLLELKQLDFELEVKN